MNKVVPLIIGGMPRTGTTFLYHVFAGHPGAFVPFRKELRFFSLNFGRGAAWYARFFDKCPAGARCFDISPDYFMDSEAAGRMSEYDPSLKVILGVRNPAAWAISLHRQLLTLDRCVPAFADFISQGTYPEFGILQRRATKRLEFSLRGHFIMEQLERYRRLLGDRLLLFDFAYFERDPFKVVHYISEFGGMPREHSIALSPKHKINSRSRGGSRLLNNVLSRDALINLAGALVPRRTLIALRMKLDQANGAKSDVSALDLDEARDLEFASDVLAADSDYVRKLFQLGPVVDGNGELATLASSPIGH